MPEDNNITVFKNGMPKGFNKSAFKPTGGYTLPIKTEGASAKWKKL